MMALHRVALNIAQAGARFSGALILLAAIIIAVDVVLRSFFSRTVGGADELSGYALAIGSAWGMSFALLHRAHIRIDSFYELCSVPVRAAIDLLCILGFILFLSLTSFYAWGVLSQSLTSNSRSISALAIPVAIPQSLWVAGFLFLLLVSVLLLVQSIVALLQGNPRALFRLIGAKSITEEVHEETADQAETIEAIKRMQK